eukprot:Em0013g726a
MDQTRPLDKDIDEPDKAIDGPDKAIDGPDKAVDGPQDADGFSEKNTKEHELRLRFGNGSSVLADIAGPDKDVDGPDKDVAGLRQGHSWTRQGRMLELDFIDMTKILNMKMEMGAQMNLKLSQAKAAGHRVVMVPLVLFSDDTSGNKIFFWKRLQGMDADGCIYPVPIPFRGTVERSCELIRFFELSKAEAWHQICVDFVHSVRYLMPKMPRKQKVHYILHLVQCKQDYGPSSSFCAERPESFNSSIRLQNILATSRLLADILLHILLQLSTSASFVKMVIIMTRKGVCDQFIYLKVNITELGVESTLEQLLNMDPPYDVIVHLSSLMDGKV